MKFKVTLASDWEYEKEVNLSSIEDFKELSDRYKHRLIVDFRPLCGDIPEIIIYDDYIE